jgi:hypothetical protein
MDFADLVLEGVIDETMSCQGALIFEKVGNNDYFKHLTASSRVVYNVLVSDRETQ